MSSTVLAMGPSTVGILLNPGLGSTSGRVSAQSAFTCAGYSPTVPDRLILPEPGLRPYRPQKWDGILMLPPISDPHPMTEPFIARSEPSPPVDPPGTYFAL